MQFLKTLFWVVLAVVVVLFARENWNAVSLSLWAGLIVEVKLPALLGAAFLLGFLPMYLVYRGRLWTLRRRLQQPERLTVANQPAPAPAPAAQPVRAEEEVVI